MTSAAPTPISPSTPTLQGLSRAEAMSLRPTRIRRMGEALEIQVSNGQVLRMEGYYKPEVKALSEQAKAKSRAVGADDTSVRGKQIRKAQELLEKAQDLADGQSLQDPAGLNEAGTMRNYWQVWQQWQGEALGLSEGLNAPAPAPLSTTPAPSAARDGAMSVLSPNKTPVSALEASGLGLGYVAAPVVGLVALAGGGGGGGASSGLAITSPATAQVKENLTFAAKVTASNSGATFSLDSTSADAALFNLNTSTGVLTFKSAPNFEATPAKTSYTVKVNAMASVISGGAFVSQTASQTLTIQLENLENEDSLVLAYNSSLGSGNTHLTASEAGSPNLVSVSGFTSGNSLSVVFTGTKGSVTKTVTETTARGVVGISLSPEDLQTLGDGSVSIVATSTDAAGNVSLPSDGNATGATKLTFTLDTVAPAFASASATYSVAENTTAVGTLAVAPVNSVADSVTWALVTDTSSPDLTASSTDSALFSIESNSGVLTFKSAPDFEHPTDADRQGTYHLRVSATDAAGNITYQNITVNLTNVVIENAPVLAFGNQVNASGGISRAEALGYSDAAVGAFGVVTATGVPAGQTLVVTFDRGNGKTVQINVAGYGNGSGKLQVPLTADQLATLGDGPIMVSAVSKDANGNTSSVSNELNLTLDTVAPAFASASATYSVAENNTAVGTLATHTAESVTWAIARDNDAANADASLFNVNATTGVLSFKTAPDFEKPQDLNKANTYRLRVIATDAAGNTASQAVSVSVTDAAEAISLVSLPANTQNVQSGVASPLPDVQVQYPHAVAGGLVSVKVVASAGALAFPQASAAALGSPVNAFFSNNGLSLTMHGTLADINAALAGLRYTSAAGNSYPNITYSVWAGANVFTGTAATSSTLYLQATSQPHVQSFSVNDSIGLPDAGGAGEPLMFSVTLSQAVSVTGTPDLQFTLGSGQVVQADYASGSGSNILVFSAPAGVPHGSNVNGKFTLTAIDLSTAHNIVAATGGAQLLSATTGMVASNGYTVDGTAPVVTPLQRQYRTSNLLVSSQALSQQLIDNYNLSEPAVFAALAGQYNTDSTKTVGGDLGWNLPATFVDPYSRTMVSLNKGQVSASPVQSQFGWHLIQVTGIRDLPGTTGDSGAGINLRVSENTPSSQALISYGANESVTWTLTGTDAALFAIDSSGALTFKTAPDFEAPQDAGADNTYQLNVVATNAVGLSTTRPITVTVTNAASGGTLTTTGSATEGQVLTASLSLPSVANGGDPLAGANPNITWHWQKKGADGLWADIYGANASTYTLPVDGSLLGAQLRVAALVTDSTGVTLNYASPAQTVVDNGSPPPALTYPAAQLLSATGAQNGLLNTGDVITASVNFNQPVTLYGNPQLILYIGNGNSKATYDSANSVEATGLLRFTYTLTSSDANDANGIAIGYLDLNGATLYDANKTTINQVVSAADNPLFMLDNTPPAVATLSFVGSSSDTAATHAEATDGFIKINGAESGATVSVTLYRASGASLVKTFTGNFSDQRIALSAADIASLGNGPITASAVVTDTAGNATTATGRLTFTLDTLAPTILTPTTWFSPENQTSIGQLSASETVTWSLVDASGNPGTSADVALNTSTGALTWKSGGLNFEDPAESKTYPLWVRAIDAAGNSSIQNITVNLSPVNEAPAISASDTGVQSLTASAHSPSSTFGAGVFAGLIITDPDLTPAFTPTLYATLIAPAGTLSGITDADLTRTGIQFSGDAAQLQTALAALSWTDAAVNDPLRSGAAAITLRVSDMGYADTSAASSTRAVLVSRLPHLDPGGGAVPSYTENATAGVALLPALTLTHASSNPGMSKVIIDMTGGVAGDALSLSAADLNLGFVLTAQPANGSTITDSNPEWVLTGPATVDLTQWQAALRGITYSSTSEDPGTSPTRGMTLKAVDAWGGTASASVPQALSVVSVSDAPTFTSILTPSAAQALTVLQAQATDLVVNASNSSAATSSASPTVTDLDSTLIYLSITPSTGITLSPITATDITGLSSANIDNTGRLQMAGTPNALTAALGRIQFNASTAGSGQLDVRVSDVSMSDAASKPPQAIYINAQGTADVTAPAFSPVAATRQTPENQQILSFKLPSLFQPPEGVIWNFDSSGADNSNFSLNALTGEISWKTAPDFEASTNPLATTGTYTGDKLYNLSFKAVDLSGNASTPLNLSLYLQDINEAPVRKTSAAAENRWVTLSQLGNGYNLDLSTLFKDADAGDTLSYSATLPNWLSLDTSNGLLKVVPGQTVPTQDTQVDLLLSATDRVSQSISVPLSLHVVTQNAPIVTGLLIADNTGSAWVGSRGQTMTLYVVFNTADLKVSGIPAASVLIEGTTYVANYNASASMIDSSSKHGAGQGVLAFNLTVPSGIDAGSVTLSGISNVAGSSITSSSTGVALNTNASYNFSVPYLIDNTAPNRPQVVLDAGLNPNNLTASSLAGNAGGVLDVVTEPGASLSVLFSNANNANQKVSKTLDSALLGLNPIGLTLEDVNNLGTGPITAQIIATDPAGNRSDPAWFNFTVI